MAVRKNFAVIWDLGGVLVRTEDPGPRLALAERLHLSRRALEDLVFVGESAMAAQLGQIAIDQHWLKVCAAVGVPPAESEALQAAFWGGDRLDQELVEAIRSLKATVKIGLLSNHYSDLRHNLEQRWQIADIFDDMVISYEVGLMKPDARIYLEAARRLDVPPHQAVFIDDWLANVEGARQAGLHAIHFKNRVQALSELANFIE